MDACKSCGKDMTLESTHWVGCYETHPQCAAFKAGLRRAAEIAEASGWTSSSKSVIETCEHIRDAILSEANK